MTKSVFSTNNIVFQGDVFPEISRKVDEIKEILNEEEESFSRTLDRGEKLFDDYAVRAKEQNAKELSGKDVWRLYDTFGFPVDLTRLMAEELGLVVNEQEFERAQAESKAASKAGVKKDALSVVKLDVHDLAALEENPDVPMTDDSAKFSASLVASCLNTLISIPKISETSLLRSRPSSMKNHLLNLLATSQMALLLVSFLTRQASTPKLVDRNMILGTSSLTASQILKWRMSRFIMAMYYTPGN